MSHVTGDAKDPDVLQQVTQAYDNANAPLVMRTRVEIGGFFGECALVPPGVVTSHGGVATPYLRLPSVTAELVGPTRGSA